MEPPSPLPLWRRYVVAVLATGIAAAVRLLFDPLLGSQLPLLIFIFPVIASAWWGGVGPGLLAVGLGAITGTWLFMEPRFEFKFALLFSDLRPIVFVIASTAFTWMCSTVRMVLRREAAASQAALAQREELRREAQARAEAAAALKEFETDLQTVFQLAAVGIARGDCRDGSIVQVNQKFCDLLGYPEAELIGKTFREITHPDDREADYVAFQRVVRGEKDEFSQEKRYLRKDGTIAWGYVNARIVRGPNGEARDSFAIVVDITERKHAEKILADRESQLRQIGDNLPQGFLYQITASLDQPRRFIYFSAGLERITGVRIDEALADANSLYALVHPNDVPRLVETEERCLREKCAFDVVLRMRHRMSGEWRWAHMRSAPRVMPDSGMMWDGIFLDITEAKRTEEALAYSMERLDMAQKAGHIGVFDWQVQTGEVVWNDEEQRIFGLKPGTFSGTIQGWRERVDPADLGRIEKELKDAMDGGRSELEFYFRIIRPDGAPRWIEGSGRFFYDDNGKPVRMVGVNIDVTERHEAQANLRAAKDAAEAASNAKDHFLATLSHELRTPLAPVVPLVAELLSRDDLPDDVHEELQIVQRNIALEARLIDDLLDLTRVTKGKLELRREVVDLHALLERTRSICYHEEVRARGIRVEIQKGSRRHHVWCDSVRIQQVFWNLINNACKFSPVGGVVVVRTFDLDEKEIVVEVQDFGVGISDVLLPKLFRPFEQGERRSADERRGLGLGLAITKPLVEVHGGRISVISGGLGKGTTFRVVLPSVPPEEVQPAPVLLDKSPPRLSRPGTKTRILLVEDHFDTAHVMERLLRGRGYEVQRVASKAEALESARRLPFHVLVSDIGLPDGSGLELMAELQKASPICAIAMSGFGTEADIKRSRDAGFLEHLVKPVDFDALVRVIRDKCTARAE